MSSTTVYSTIILLIAGLVYYFCINKSIEEIHVDTKYGTLKGFKSLSRDGRTFNSFTAIPYAKPPVEKLRFQPPIQIEKWEGVKDATIQSPVCLQFDFALMRKVLGQEDCLYLNVFTPKIPKKTKDDKLLPVMVYIHGGYYNFGGTDVYGPVYFMDEDVVLVTINYRLGAFGFLSTGDDVVSGNMGMKDQVMALKWVQSTIKDFGGDPNLVTIFGESAGGASVHLHLFSPLSLGLFHRAISQSGTSFCPWSNIEKDTKAQSKKLGELLKCPTESSEILVKCLQGMDGNKIAETQKPTLELYFANEELYGPTVEKGNDISKGFLTKSTRKLYDEGKVFSVVPWMSGFTSAEGCLISSVIIRDDETLDNFSKNWKKIAPQSLIYSDKPGVTDKIEKYYFGNNPKPFTMNDYKKITDLYSDRYFGTCQLQAARLHSKFAPTYSYYFDHQNLNSAGILLAASTGKYPVIYEILTAVLKRYIYTNILNWEVQDYGVCHLDELQYLFKSFPLIDISESSPHYKFSKSFVKLWVNFAKNGNPGKYDGIEWKEIQPNQTPRYMYIGDGVPVEMIDEPNTPALKFWESLQLTPI